MAITTLNLASKYSPKVAERWTLVSQASEVTNNDYDFIGVQSVKVYKPNVVALNDYSRTGTTDRYGTADDLAADVQDMKVNRDRSFTFVIDKGDNIQSQMILEAGKALDREIREVVTPEYDKYVFEKIATSVNSYTDAFGGIHVDTTAPTKHNAYELFLKAQEVVGNANVPDTGRVCLCSYKFANLLKQDPSFMKYGDMSQKMLIKGVMGEVDNTKIIKVPASRLPEGCSFILTHPMACCAPKQLVDYKIHDNPPGISGYKVEGRLVYDAFVLDNKKDAIFYNGTNAVVPGP